MSKINKVVVKGVSYDIEDKNEATRAKKAEQDVLNESIKRLQGLSENSNSTTDPFKFIGSFAQSEISEFNDTLNNLTYDTMFPFSSKSPSITTALLAT